MQNVIIEIVYDYNTGKLRARPVNGQGWVRFPRDLRVRGAMYRCTIKPGKAGSWIQVGGKSAITAVRPAQAA